MRDNHVRKHSITIKKDTQIDRRGCKSHLTSCLHHEVDVHVSESLTQVEVGEEEEDPGEGTTDIHETQVWDTEDEDY